HARGVWRPANRRMWPLAAEATASLAWVSLLALSTIAVVADVLVGAGLSMHRFALACGIAIAVVAALQLAVALLVERRQDPRALLVFALGPLRPLLCWMRAAAAAVRAELPALVRRPRAHRVAWDIPRDGLADA